jgi:hypothetical protein
MAIALAACSPGLLAGHLPPPRHRPVAADLPDSDDAKTSAAALLNLAAVCPD